MKTIMWISAVLCWLVPSALASFAADGCVASGEVPKVTQPQLAAALCCRDGDWCDSDIGGRCHGDSVGFAEASDLCASRAARVCTLAELASRICCDTGCGYDGLAAWYDNCVSNPCVHGTCASTKESYTCTCDADFTGDDCDEAILTTLTGGPSAPGPSTPQPSTPGPSTSGSSQTFAPAPGQESSRGELFGAHSFDFLNEEIEKLKARMVNRTAEASAEALEALGVEDVLSRITNNGELKELEEQAKDKWSELFGDFFDMGNFSFDIGDAFEPVMERAGNVLKTCSSSRLPQDPQARSAQALAAEDDLVLMANRTLGERVKVGATFAMGLEYQTGRGRVFGAFALNGGFRMKPDSKTGDAWYNSISAAGGAFAFGENKPTQGGVVPRVFGGMSVSIPGTSPGACFLKITGRYQPKSGAWETEEFKLYAKMKVKRSYILQPSVVFSFPCGEQTKGQFELTGVSVNFVMAELLGLTKKPKSSAGRTATVLADGPKWYHEMLISVSVGVKLFPWRFSDPDLAAPQAPPPAPGAASTSAPETKAPATGAPATVLRRSAEVLSVEAKVAKARVLAEGVATGELVTPFCFGDCVEGDGNGTNDARRSIFGQASMQIESDCKAEMRATVEEITLGGVAYVLGGDDMRAALETVHVEGLGFRDVELSMDVTIDGNVLFNAVGAPSYDDGSTLSFLGTDLTIGVTAEKQPMYKRLRLTAGMGADDSEKVFRIRDIQGHFGLSLHMQYEKMSSSMMPSSMMPGSVSTEFKVNLPVAVCVENCEDSASRRDLYFIGELGLEFNPTAQVSGDLMAAGWWYKAFGMPFLHLGDMILGLSLDLSTFLPSRLTAGGAVCLGTADNCENRQAPYIEARGYVGLSWKTMQDNFFIAMVSRLTIGDLFDVFSEFAPELSSVKPLVGSKILESGIYPFDESACDAGAELDTDCFAVVSFAFIDKELDFSAGNVVEIPSGVQVSGKLELGGWEIQVYVKADERSLVADVRMDPLALTIGGFDLMRIGERFENGHVVGGARFFMAFIAVPPQAGIDIEGAIEIPLIGATGEVSIVLNDDEFSFRTSVSLFGGIWSSTAHAAWDWRFSRFNMGLEDVSFGVVKLEELSFAFDSAEKLGQFKGKITVLGIAGVSVDVRIGGTGSGGTLFSLAFDVSATAAGATLTVSGQGSLRKPLRNSDWDLTPSTRFDPEALKEDVGKAVKAAAEVAEEAWGAVTDFAQDGVKFIQDKVGGFVLDTFDKAGDFLNRVLKSPVVKKLADNVKKILKGDFGGFLDSVGGAIKGVFTTSSVRNHKITTLSSMDEYKCNKKRETWEVRTCDRFKIYCSSKSHARMIPNESCLKARAMALEAAEEKAEDIAVVEKEVEDSKAGNPGLVAVLAGAQIPAPRIGLVGGAVLQTRNGSLPDAKVAVAIDAGVQALAGKGGGSTVEGKETPFSVPSSLDYSSPEAFEASVREATKSIVVKAKDAVLSKQAGVKLAKADLLMKTPAPFKFPLLPWSSWSWANVFKLNARSGDALDVSEVATPVVGAAKPVTHLCSEDTPWETPDLEFTASQCREASVDVIDTENLAGPPFGMTTSFVCGTLFKKVSWQAKYGSDCGRATSSVVEQIVTIVPSELELTHEPGPATVSAAEFERPSEGNTWTPQWDVECYLSMLIDSEDVLVSSTCGSQVIERTWTASIDFEGTAVDTRSCEPPPTKSYVQLITVLTAENC